MRECISRAQKTAWENGVVCAVLATLVFSFSSLQVKLTGGRVPVLQLCIIRSSISFCTSIVVGTAQHIRPLFGHRENLRLLLMRGCFGTIAIGTSYVALLTLPLGDAVTLAQLRPPVTAVMARLLLQESSLGLQGGAGCLVSVAGVVVLAHPPFLLGGHQQWSQRRLLGTLCGVASTFMGSGTSYCIRRIGTREPALVVALYFHTMTLLLMAPPLLLGLPQRITAVVPLDGLLLLGIAGSSFCAQLLMTRVVQLVPAARAAAVSFMGVVYSHVLGWLVFREQLTAATLAGGLLIFAGALLVTLRKEPASTTAGSAAGGSGPRGSKQADAPAGRASHETAAAVAAAAEAEEGTAPPDGDESAQQLLKGGGAVESLGSIGSRSRGVTGAMLAGGLTAADTAPGPARTRTPAWLQLLLGRPPDDSSNSSELARTSSSNAGSRCRPLLQPAEPSSDDMRHPLLPLRSSSSLQPLSPVISGSDPLFSDGAAAAGRNAPSHGNGMDSVERE